MVEDLIRGLIEDLIVGVVGGGGVVGLVDGEGYRRTARPAR